MPPDYAMHTLASEELNSRIPRERLRLLLDALSHWTRASMANKSSPQQLKKAFDGSYDDFRGGNIKTAEEPYQWSRRLLGRRSVREFKGR